MKPLGFNPKITPSLILVVAFALVGTSIVFHVCTDLNELTLNTKDFLHAVFFVLFLMIGDSIGNTGVFYPGLKFK